MAKRKRETTRTVIERRIEEGRGQGTGVDYKPWLVVQDVSSRGLVHRIKGWKAERVHHLLSNLERDYFYLLEWSLSVTDIREQFPLLPLAETLEIADRAYVLENGRIVLSGKGEELLKEEKICKAYLGI